jgi:hypothetical protein
VTTGGGSGVVVGVASGGGAAEEAAVAAAGEADGSGGGALAALGAATVPEAVGSGAAKGTAGVAPAAPVAALPEGDVTAVLSALMGVSKPSLGPQAVAAIPRVTSARARLAWSIRVFDMEILSFGEARRKREDAPLPCRGARCRVAQGAFVGPFGSSPFASKVEVTSAHDRASCGLSPTSLSGQREDHSTERIGFAKARARK